MLLYIFLFLTSMLGVQQDYVPWALKYEVDFKESDNNLIHYIVVKEDQILSIRPDPSDDKIASCYIYSLTRNTIDIRILNHRNKICFGHLMSFEEYLDSTQHYIVDFINKDRSAANFLDSASNIVLKATFSDSIPNVFLEMIPYEQIKYSPITVEYDNRVVQLTKTIHDVDEVNKILAYTNVYGYKVIDMEELKAQMPEKTGYTYEQAKSILLQSKQ